MGSRIKIVSNIQLKNGTFIDDVTVEGRVAITVDPNYGADADGNRGQSVTFTECEIEEITRPVGDRTDVPFTEEGEPLDQHWITRDTFDRLKKELIDAYWDQDEEDEGPDPDAQRDEWLDRQQDKYR